MGLFRAVMLGCLAGLVLSAAGVTGEWGAEVQSLRGQSVAISLRLKEDDGVLTGSVRDPQGENPISNGAIDGDEIRFSVITDRDGYQVIQRYRGTLEEEDVIHFSLSLEEQHSRARAIPDFVAQRLS